MEFIHFRPRWHEFITVVIIIHLTIWEIGYMSWTRMSKLYAMRCRNATAGTCYPSEVNLIQLVMLCHVILLILLLQMLFLSSALRSLCWSTMHWLTMGLSSLSSYIVGETWKCNTKKRCVVTSLVFYLFLQVSLTVTYTSVWSTLKFKGAFIRYRSFFFNSASTAS